MNEAGALPELSISVPERLPVGPDGKIHLLQGRAPEPLTAEQLEGIRRLKEHREQSAREWEALTPEERAFEEAGWEEVLRNPGCRSDDSTAASTPAEGSPPAIIHVRGTAEQRVKNQTAIDLFQRRLEEAASMSRAEVAEADRDWERFRQIMNENRTSGRMPYVD